MYLKLIVQEKDLAEIMEYVRMKPGTIEEYADMLREEYQEEVIEVYKKHIKQQANLSSNRSQYQGVCRILKIYKKIAGQQSLEKIKAELKILYKKRPAFLEN